MNEILKYFPMELRNAVLLSENINLEELCEIRIRVNRPVILRDREKECIVKRNSQEYIITKECIGRIFESICGNLCNDKRWTSKF